MNNKPIDTDDPEFQRFLATASLDDLLYAGRRFIKGQQIRSSAVWELRNRQKCELNKLTNARLEELLASCKSAKGRQIIEVVLHQRNYDAEAEYLKSIRYKKLDKLQAMLEKQLDPMQRRVIEGRIVALQEKVEKAEHKRQYKLRLAEFRREVKEITSIEDARLHSVENCGIDYDDWWPVVLPVVQSLTTTVKQLAGRLFISETTARKLLDELAIEPCYIATYRIGTHAHRKDVTAYYYQPEVRQLLSAELDRRDLERQALKRKADEKRQIERDRKDYEKKTGFCK